MKPLSAVIFACLCLASACNKNQGSANTDGIFVALAECGALAIQTTTGETFLPKNIDAFSGNVSITVGQKVVFSYINKEPSPANTCVRTLYPVTVTSIRNQ